MFMTHIGILPVGSSHGSGHEMVIKALLNERHVIIDGDEDYAGGILGTLQTLGLVTFSQCNPGQFGASIDEGQQKKLQKLMMR